MIIFSFAKSLSTAYCSKRCACQSKKGDELQLQSGKFSRWRARAAPGWHKRHVHSNAHRMGIG